MTQITKFPISTKGIDSITEILPEDISVSDMRLIFDESANEWKKSQALLNDVTIVATFSDLSSFPLREGQIVMTRGYLSDGNGSAKYIGTLGSPSYPLFESSTATDGIFAKPIVDNGVIDVYQTGAVFDGITDDAESIQEAINVAEGEGYSTVVFPPKAARINSTLVVSKPIKLIGTRPEGESFPGGITAVAGTLLDWGGGAAAIMYCGKINLGLEISGFTMDGNNTASYCLHYDTVNGGEVNNCWFKNAIFSTLKVNAQHGTCSWNTFRGLRFSNGYGYTASGTQACLDVAGYEGGYNACHNTFINLNFEHARVSHALLLGFCDNCTFIDIYTNRDSTDGGVSGTGYGVTYVASGSSFAYANTFIHLQPGPGGYVEPAMAFSPYATNIIYNYSLDNAAPPPVLGSNYGTYIHNNGNEIGGIRRIGINTAPTSTHTIPTPLEIETQGETHRGTIAKLGQNTYFSIFDNQYLAGAGMLMNGAGTVIAKATSLGGYFIDSSRISFYLADGLTVDSPVTVNNALMGLDIGKSGSTWSYGFCGVGKTNIATGFGTPTGAARLSNFPGATATLAQTSGALADLILELKVKGLIGA